MVPGPHGSEAREWRVLTDEAATGKEQKEYGDGDRKQGPYGQKLVIPGLLVSPQDSCHRWKENRLPRIDVLWSWIPPVILPCWHAHWAWTRSRVNQAVYMRADLVKDVALVGSALGLRLYEQAW